MEKLILFMIDFLGMVATEYMMYKIFVCVLKPRYSMLCILIWTMLANFLNTYLKSTIFNTMLEIDILYVVFMTAILLIFYKGKWYEYMLAFFLNGIATVIAELVCGMILFGGLGYNLQTALAGMEWGSVLIRAFALVIVGIVTYMVWHVQKSLQYVLSGRNSIPVLLLYGATFLMLFIYCGLIGHYQLKTSLWSWVYSALIVYVAMYIIQMIGMQEVRQQSQEKLEFIRKKDENVQKYYHNLVSKLRNTTELRDEYQRKLGSIYAELGMPYEPDMCPAGERDSALLNEGDTADTGVSGYLQAIVEQIVDGKKRELDKLGYSYDLDIQIPEEAAIELMDISGLLNNLLDNAVEAVHGYVENAKKNGIKCGQEKKEKLSGSHTEVYIRGNAYVERDNFVIRVENVKSPEQKVIEIDDRFVTSKTDKTGHGYGLQIIQRIAEKYHGKMEVSYTSHSFMNCVTMKIK